MPRCEKRCSDWPAPRYGERSGQFFSKRPKVTFNEIGIKNYFYACKLPRELVVRKFWLYLASQVSFRLHG
jgi:hypothetical protein